MTAEDLIRLALINGGCVSLSQTLYAEDVYLALDMLNGILTQWQRRRWLVMDETDVPVTSTGAASYTVGPAGDFVMPRPDLIVSAFARLQAGGANQMDYPLEIIQAREDWNKVALKQISTFPTAMFYDSGWPTGTAYFWPIPVAGLFELHLTVKSALQVLANLSDVINMPPEYTQALIYSLARILRPSYSLPPDPALEVNARTSLDVIRTANLQLVTLGMPAGLTGRQRAGMGMVGQGLGRAFTLDGGSVLT